MPWLFLLIAGVLEIGWAVGLKYSDGFTRLWPSVLTILALVLSFIFLSLAVKHLPIGTAYAIWTGIGAVGACILGILLFKEPVGALRVACMALIVLGIVGLKFTASQPAT